jgi:hypothetical protein
VEVVCEVLLGNYDYIQVLVKDSWPLFLTHTIGMQVDQPLNYEGLKDQVFNFLNLKHKNSTLTLPS